MVAWLKADHPKIKIAGAENPSKGQFLSADYEIVLNDHEWLSLLATAAS